MKRGEGKGRYTESHDIIFQLLVTNCVADTPGPIPIKIGMYVTKYPTFVQLLQYIFQGFQIYGRGSKSPFPC